MTKIPIGTKKCGPTENFACQFQNLSESEDQSESDPSHNGIKRRISNLKKKIHHFHVIYYPAILLSNKTKVVFFRRMTCQQFFDKVIKNIPLEQKKKGNDFVHEIKRYAREG